MANNIGYLTARTDKESDEIYTPFYAVEPIVKFLPRDKIIWCAFDKEWSAFVVLLKENGFSVVATHIDDGQNYFEYEPQEWDILVSNPPFSLKDSVLKRAQELNKPFALLLPIATLQGQRRFPHLKDIQLLTFDKRICYHKTTQFSKGSGAPFASGYFCKDLLPKDLIIEELQIYERDLDFPRNHIR